MLFNLLLVDGSQDIYGWTDGSVDVPPFEVTAGTKKKIILEFDWDDFFAREVTKDFSLIVYGSDGEVTLLPSNEDNQNEFETITRIGDISEEDSEAVPH